MNDYVFIDSCGLLSVDGLRCVDLAEKYGTPLYVLSENQIRRNFQRLHDAFAEKYPSMRCHYAVKANSSQAVLRILRNEGAAAECVSNGEIEAAMRAGFDPSEIIFNGANKSFHDLRVALNLGIEINVDSLEELESLVSLTRETDLNSRIRFRVAISQLVPSTYLSAKSPVVTEFYLNKWGMNWDQIERAFQTIGREKRIELLGLHFHLGLTRMHNESYPAAIERTVERIALLGCKYGWEAVDLDIGGGFRYGSDPESGASLSAPPSPMEYATVISQAVKRSCERHHIKLPRLVMEPGRHLVGNAGILLTRVGVTKRDTASGIPIVNVDAAFIHTMMVALLPASYPVVVASMIDKAGWGSEEVDITGQTCSPDVLAYRCSLAPIHTGDLLAFLDTGAYCEALAGNYNTLLRPATVLVRGEDSFLTTRRETFDDIFGFQLLPPHL